VLKKRERRKRELKMDKCPRYQNNGYIDARLPIKEREREKRKNKYVFLWKF